MKKIYIFTAIFALIASVGFAAPSFVLAQYYNAYVPAPVTYTYVSTPSYVNSYGIACTNLTTNLYKGLRDVTTGGQISALQSFLVSQRYLGVTPTGQFGILTYQALIQYQIAHGLIPNGIADIATRDSIRAISCGGSYAYNNGQYPYGYNNNYAVPVVNSLSVSSGPVGTFVTIYGSGFDYSNNTVNFDGTAITGVPSYSGTALSFTVPQVYNNYNYNNYYSSEAYPVYVTNSRGTSGSLQFTVTGNNYCYNNNNYNYVNVYPYNSNCYNNNGALSFSNVSGQTNLTVGTQGTWSLTLFNQNSNSVSVSARWGDENLYNYAYAPQQTTQSSYVQGQQTITFTHTYYNSGNYTIVFTATNSTGMQTTINATVNVSGSNYNYNNNQPYLSSISPNSGRVGTQIVLYGSGFATYGSNTVHFGNGGTMNISSNNGTTIYYTIPNYISGCDVTNSNYGVACPLYAQQVTPGIYPIYVSDGNGQSNTIYFTVTY